MKGQANRRKKAFTAAVLMWTCSSFVMVASCRAEVFLVNVSYVRRSQLSATILLLSLLWIFVFPEKLSRNFNQEFVIPRFEVSEVTSTGSHTFLLIQYLPGSRLLRIPLIALTSTVMEELKNGKLAMFHLFIDFYFWCLVSSMTSIFIGTEYVWHPP